MLHAVQPGFDINKLIQEAHIRWLKPAEVLFILENHERFEITQKPPNKPPSNFIAAIFSRRQNDSIVHSKGGSLFLFNRRVLRYFRNDGHSWKKKKNGKTIREGHERLKVGNCEALNCYYAHGEQIHSFQRRSYWMLDQVFEHIVLVHYREVVEGTYMPESFLSSSNDSCPTLRYSTSLSDNQAQFYVPRTTESKGPFQNSRSPGSAEEVCSQFIGRNIKLSHPNKMDGPDSCNQLSDPELSEALKKLEVQLSLESLDTDKDGLASSEVVPLDNLNVETHLQHQNYEMTIPVESLQNPLNEENSNFLIEGGIQYDNILKSPPDDLVWPQSPIFPFHITDNNVGNYSQLMQEKDTGLHSAENSQHSSLIPDVFSDPFQIGVPTGAESRLSPVQRHLFRIREVSPEWAFSTERTKVVITGDFVCTPSEYTWSILFGDIEVPLEIVQDGVLRCIAPPHPAGKVKLCVVNGNKQPCSELSDFQFCDKFEIKNSSRGMSQEDATKRSEELLFLISFVQTLFFGHVSAEISEESDLEPDIDPLNKLKGSINRLQKIIRAIQDGSMTSEDIMNAILQELLKDKLHHWLTSEHQGDTDRDFHLSKNEQSIIHMVSGLGFQWALCPILNSGVGINYRDSNGWTALHWAAYFGREQMVAVLLAAGASALSVTNPSVQDPDGKTPAALAAANGHKGLAGYLSEAALTSHLFSLTTEQNENSQWSASVQVDRGVDRISQRNAILHGGTEDQLSLKDSLAAVRNSAQAACRIQAAFRAYSFRKNQQKPALCQGDNGLSPLEMHEISVASRLNKAYHRFCDKFDKAALSIQTNYRSWKKRKEFLQIRKHVVKIQAHVRGHFSRKRYKEFISSVSVVEKLVLRWHRRGVGLRGFHPEQVSMEEEEEEEEEDIIQAFRKQKVVLAIDAALSRVLSVVDSPKARQQYRRMLEGYQNAKFEMDQNLAEDKRHP